MKPHEPLHLFQGFGVELEHMIVDAETLDVRPITDKVIEAECGHIETEIERGEISWSNELVLHVIETKTNGPASSLDGLADQFAANITKINAHLSNLGARLMPTAMHPWMDPLRETVLWPHEYNAVYEAFDKIFGCQGHGWSNLQSNHLNLPFAGDEEFRRLHTAIRTVIPIVPALSASTPLQDGALTGLMDSRLENYRHHMAKIPSIMGDDVLPEVVRSKADYQTAVLGRVYRDIAPFDPEGILQFEWCNARGAIARFDRGAVELRVLDVQECPAADLAVTGVIVEVLRGLVEERWSTLEQQERLTADVLTRQFRACIREAEEAAIDESDYAAALGLKSAKPVTAHALWENLAERVGFSSEPLDLILDEGPVARRITRTLGDSPTRADLARVYGKLCDCLAENRLFNA